MQGLDFFGGMPLRGDDLLQAAQVHHQASGCCSSPAAPRSSPARGTFAHGTCVAMQWDSDNQDDSVVVLSDVWLDRPETLDRLRTLFSGDTLLCCATMGPE